MTTKHPEVSVRLIGNDGNAFSILGACQMEAWRAKVPKEEEIDLFLKEAISGDYDHLLQTCMQWFDIN